MTEEGHAPNSEPPRERGWLKAIGGVLIGFEGLIVLLGIVAMQGGDKSLTEWLSNIVPQGIIALGVFLLFMYWDKRRAQAAADERED